MLWFSEEMDIKGDFPNYCHDLIPAPPALILIRAATDQKTHGSDRFADQSHGSDNFSDHQKKKNNQDK